MKKFISAVMVLLLVASLSVSVFSAQSAVFIKEFDSLEEMTTYLDNYSKNFPNIEYSEDGVKAPGDSYQLVYKDVVYPILDSAKYTPEILRCSETNGGLGINKIHILYVESDTNLRIGFNIEFLYSDEDIAQSMLSLEEKFKNDSFFKGQISGYDYFAGEHQEAGESWCQYVIVLDGVRIDFNANKCFDKSFVEGIVLSESGVTLPVYEQVPQESTDVSGELLKAIRLLHPTENIERDDISLSDYEEISPSKSIVRYTIKGFGYSCDVVYQRIGEYKLYVPSRPLPMLFTEGHLYELKDAYSKGLLTDAELEIISGMNSDSFSLDKTELVYGDSNCDWTLDILDATLIQRYVAHIDDENDIDLELADFDRDCEVTVLDATGVQRALVTIVE